MTYTQLRTQHCPPVDTVLSRDGYISEFDCGMRRWLTESCQQALSPTEDRAAGQSLAGGCNVGIELCTPKSDPLLSCWRVLRVVWQLLPSLSNS